jgi:hypothetical protein
VGTALSNLRRGRNRRHVLTGLLRQSIFGRLAGYEDVNDAERLSVDPAAISQDTRRFLSAGFYSIILDTTFAIRFSKFMVARHITRGLAKCLG